MIGCIEWAGARDNHGYGVRRVKGVLRKAHRLAYEAAKGPIPDGFDIDHLCRNRACVNPDHLEAVTRAENLRRGSRTKLTIADAREIRALAGHVPIRQLGKHYGVSHGYISRIINGHLWRDEDAA